MYALQTVQLLKLNNRSTGTLVGIGELQKFSFYSDSNNLEDD